MSGKVFRNLSFAVMLVLGLGLAWTGPAPANALPAVNPAPVQLFYLTLPEADGLTVLDTINSQAESPMWTYFSVAIGVSGTYVYYDQWENGYDSDIANPANLYAGGNPGGTQVWGNGEADDGCPPNKAGVALTCTDANDVLNAGDVIVPFNSIPIPRDSNQILFDAKDKVGASASIAMARATWATGSSTLNAFAHEMYATAEWGTLYRSPVGTNTANAGAMFEYSGLSIMASQNDTDVQVDADANGVYETQITLQEGGSYLAGSISQGARVLADKPVQVLLVTGDIGSNYESRDMNLLPVSKYGSSYWSPVGKDSGGVLNPVRLFLYNPGASSVYITCKTPSATPINLYRDEFATQAYNNSNGTSSWSSQFWTEENDDGSAASGTIYINTADDELRFRGNSAPSDAIRRTANLSGYGTATLSFELNGSGIDANDDIALDLSSDGGSTWTLGVLNFDSGNDPGGAATTLDISSYSSSNTTIRFRMIGTLATGTGDGERWDIDDVNIAVPGVATTTQAVAANGVVTFSVDDNQAAHCYASTSNGTATSDPIFGVGTMDTDGQAWDWSFTLFPDSFLSTDALVGLGLGQDPTQAYSENGNPLWVTSACVQGTWVYVDWDNNGVADGVDTDGNGTAEPGSGNGIFVSYLQSVRLFDPTGGLYAQTGARVWSRTASGYPNRTDPNATPGCSLAVAWGQDPANATASAPGLDVGTSVPPLRLIEGTKSLTLKTDVDGDGLLSPGDIATYVMTVKNSGAVIVNNVYLYDTVPVNTTFNSNTTERDLTSNNGTGPWILISDSPNPGDFPLAQPGGVFLGNLDPGDTFYVRFDVTLGVGDYEEILNCDTAFTAAGELTRCATNQVASADWGDLPDVYGTTLAANGPRHSPSSLRLGTWFDREYQGQPSAGANDDDLIQTTMPLGDDEDGVTPAAWSNANLGNFNVFVTGGPGCLNAWMDFTNGAAVGQDGDFNDSLSGYSEHIINNVSVPDGASVQSFGVPTGVGPSGNTGPYYFRFRLSPLPCGTINPTGAVTGGEVEDYQFTFSPLGVVLVDFRAMCVAGQPEINWETGSELTTLGFNVWRNTSDSGPQDKLTETMIPAHPGSAQGYNYSFLDTTAVENTTYYYWLEDIDTANISSLTGPITVLCQSPTAVSLDTVEANPAAGLPIAALSVTGLAALALAGTVAWRKRR